MQFRRPEAAGHGASFSVVITAFEQIDFLGTAARRIGKRFDGVGDAQRHMRGAIVRIDAVAVGIVGGDEHEHRLAVEIPSEHRRVRTLYGKWHRVYGLADAALTVRVSPGWNLPSAASCAIASSSSLFQSTARVAPEPSL